MIVVTGGAGFIGSNLVHALNQRGIENILVVDNLTNAEKVKNLADLKIADYMDKQEFLQNLSNSNTLSDVTAVLHQGACSDTMAADGAYVLRNNYSYSKSLFEFCCRQKVSFIYASSASVYGAKETFVESPEFAKTLNAYAYSKLLFDNYIRRQSSFDIQVVGLRYFNVYGPREQHKGRMASVAWHFYNQFHADETVRLFKGTEGYQDGEQRRDFISVEDVIAVNLFFLDDPDKSGIFNVGTGRCQSYNEMALAVINGIRTQQKQNKIELPEAIEKGLIQYVDMPQALHGKYQNYTQANLDKLREIGFDKSMYSVEDGVFRYQTNLASN